MKHGRVRAIGARRVARIDHRHSNIHACLDVLRFRLELAFVCQVVGLERRYTRVSASAASVRLGRGSAYGERPEEKREAGLETRGVRVRKRQGREQVEASDVQVSVELLVVKVPEPGRGALGGRLRAWTRVMHAPCKPLAGRLVCFVLEWA